MNLKFMTLAFSFLWLASCSSSPETSGESAGEYTTDNLSSGYEYYSDGGRIFVGPQLSAEDIKELKSDKDIDVLINVRGMGENKKVKFDPKVEAQSVGIAFYQVPFMKKLSPSHKAISKMESILKKHSGKNILVYCASGNRAAGWYAVHQATNNSLSTSAAMDHAKGMGLNNRKLKGIMTAYLASSGITTEDVVSEATSGAEEEMEEGMSKAKGAAAGKAMKKAKKAEAEVVDEALETEDPMDY